MLNSRGVLKIVKPTAWFFSCWGGSTIADNAAGYAAFSLMDEEDSILTVEFKLNLLAPAEGKFIIGKGKVLKAGKTLTICRSDVYAVQNGKERLVAASQSTLMQVFHKKE